MAAGSDSFQPLPCRGGALNNGLPAPLTAWFASRGWAPRRHQLDMLEVGARGPARAARRRHGGGEDAGRVPADARRADRDADRGPAHALCLAAQGAGGRCAAQPAHPDRGDGARYPRRDAHRRHALRPQGAPADTAAADAADDARIAQPAALLSRQLPDVRGAEDDHRRRGPRLRDRQARRPACRCAWRGCSGSRPPRAGSRCRPPSPIRTAIAPGSRPTAISIR